MGRKFISLSAVLLAVVLLCTGCYSYTAPKETIVPTVTPEPLKAQEAVEDAGAPFTYKVSGTITDNMVLQRNQYINVYGFSDEIGGIVYAEFKGETRYGKVDENGEWHIQFNPQEASTEPTTLKVYNKSEGADGGKTFSNILIGDVWIIAGQSNAQLSLAGTLENNPDFTKTISEKDNIRLFTQYYWDYDYFDNPMTEEANDGTKEPIKDIVDMAAKYPGYAEKYQAENGKAYEVNSWKLANEENAKAHSAVGYYFAKQVADNTDVPIGMVMMTAGGAALRDFIPTEKYDSTKHNHGTSLFKATEVWNDLMVAFEKTSFAGMLWYQGEANEKQYDVYAEDLQAFVGFMREVWGESLPFYSVQITSHNDSGSAWPYIAELRHAQAASLDLIENYYVVCSMDYGSNSLDTDWAHPKNKKHIGDRLAYVALSKIYAPDKYDIQDYGSPTVGKIEIKDDHALVYFKYVGDGLKTVDGSDKVLGFYSQEALMVLDAEIVSKNCVKVMLQNRAGGNLTGDKFTLEYGSNAMADQTSCNLQNSNGIGALAFSYTYKPEN